MLINVNAVKIIEEINRLPDTEKGKVVEFVEALRASKKIRYIDSADVEKTADEVFRAHAPLFEKLAQ